jgi:hypothetical protein
MTLRINYVALLVNFCKCTFLFTEKAYKSWERFLQFFGCVNLLDICFHVYLPILSYQVRIYKPILIIPHLGPVSPTPVKVNCRLKYTKTLL